MDLGKGGAGTSSVLLVSDAPSSRLVGMRFLWMGNRTPRDEQVRHENTSLGASATARRVDDEGGGGLSSWR